MIIDSVVRTQYINVTDTQPRRHSKCRANALRRVAMMPTAYTVRAQAFHQLVSGSWIV